MRIISNVRDYYDCMMGTGMDLECTWVRNVDREKSSLEIPRLKFSWSDLVVVRRYLVGYCGEVCPMLQVSVKHYTGKHPTAYCYDEDDVYEFIFEHFPKEAHWFNNRGYSVKDDLRLQREQCQNFFLDGEDRSHMYKDVFLDNYCPIWITRAGEYYADKQYTYFHGRQNPGKQLHPADALMLKDIQFYRLRPTQLAFQDIYQYITDVLGTGNPEVPEIDDETLRDAKGFNDRSFKKEPGKKRGAEGEI